MLSVSGPCWPHTLRMPCIVTTVVAIDDALALSYTSSVQSDGDVRPAASCRALSIYMCVVTMCSPILPLLVASDWLMLEVVYNVYTGGGGVCSLR